MFEYFINKVIFDKIPFVSTKEITELPDIFIHTFDFLQDNVMITVPYIILEPSRNVSTYSAYSVGNAPEVILYQHGNGENLTSCFNNDELRFLTDQGYVVISWGYPGKYYSTLKNPLQHAVLGKNLQTTPKNINIHMEQMYKHIEQLYNGSDIIIYGFSIGTGPSVHIASLLQHNKGHDVNLILRSPFTSINDLIKEHLGFNVPFYNGGFSNISYQLYNIKILIYHGDMDRVINVSNSSKLYKKWKLTNSIKFKCIKGMNHSGYIKSAPFFINPKDIL